MSFEAGELVPVGGGDPIRLIRPTLTVGRRESCDICLRFPNVSSVHCELTYKDGYWQIRDLGSTNGVKVNGTRVQQKPLRPGDEITIAKKKYKIEYTPLVGRRALDELIEDEVMSLPLLEKAGLVRPKRDHREPPPNNRPTDPRTEPPAEPGTPK